MVDWTTGQQVTVAECSARTGEPVPGGRRLSATVNGAGAERGTVLVWVPFLGRSMEFEADTGYPLRGTSGWRLQGGDAPLRFLSPMQSPDGSRRWSSSALELMNDMRSPVICSHCGCVYDLEAVEVTADVGWKTWTAPCCGHRAAGRDEATGKSGLDFRVVPLEPLWGGDEAAPPARDQEDLTGGDAASRAARRRALD